MFVRAVPFGTARPANKLPSVLGIHPLHTAAFSVGETHPFSSIPQPLARTKYATTKRPINQFEPN
jgi:hypothetical protein